jgi:hypothetical protein
MAWGVRKTIAWPRKHAMRNGSSRERGPLWNWFGCPETANGRALKGTVRATRHSSRTRRRLSRDLARVGNGKAFDDDRPRRYRPGQGGITAYEAPRPGPLASRGRRRPPCDSSRRRTSPCAPSKPDRAVADGAAEQDDEGLAEGEPRLGHYADNRVQDQTTMNIYIELLPCAYIRTLRA